MKLRDCRGFVETINELCSCGGGAPPDCCDACKVYHAIGDWEISAPAKPVPRPRDEYHEDMGTVLWWKFPIQEPPYCGSDFDDDFPEYVTHWTPLGELPEEPKS